MPTPRGGGLGGVSADSSAQQGLQNCCAIPAKSSTKFRQTSLVWQVAFAILLHGHSQAFQPASPQACWADDMKNIALKGHHLEQLKTLHIAGEHRFHDCCVVPYHLHHQPGHQPLKCNKNKKQNKKSISFSLNSGYGSCHDMRRQNGIADASRPTTGQWTLGFNHSATQLLI